MSTQNIFRKIIGITAFLFAFIRLAKSLHWSAATTAVIGVVATIALLALVYRITSKAKKDAESGQQPKPQRRSVVVLCIIALMLIYGGVMLAYTVVHTWLLARAEQTWPTTDATIASSSIRSYSDKHGRMSWSPEWTYSYTVSGHSYLAQSEAIPGGYYANWYPLKELAEQGAMSRPDGDTVVAYYDPANPQRSVLDRRTTSIGSAWVLLGLTALMFAGAGLMVAAGFSVRKQARPKTSSNSIKT